jgi:hypothetical protein
MRDVSREQQQSKLEMLVVLMLMHSTNRDLQQDPSLDRLTLSCKDAAGAGYGGS